MSTTMSPTKADQVEAMLKSDEDEPSDPQTSEASPIPYALREAITWARMNGVVEMDLPGSGRFVLRPAAPPQMPTKADLQAKFPKRTLAPGGFDVETLFASSPNPVVPGSPFVPDSDEPLPPPDQE